MLMVIWFDMYTAFSWVGYQPGIFVTADFCREYLEVCSFNSGKDTGLDTIVERPELLLTSADPGIIAIDSEYSELQLGLDLHFGTKDLDLGLCIALCCVEHRIVLVLDITEL